jgi:hypothetical protein
MNIKKSRQTEDRSDHPAGPYYTFLQTRRHPCGMADASDDCEKLGKNLES